MPSTRYKNTSTLLNTLYLFFFLLSFGVTVILRSLYFSCIFLRLQVSVLFLLSIDRLNPSIGGVFFSPTMTSITGSPSPKPRAGRNNHRQTKSSSSISVPSQFNAKHKTQHPNLHFHNNHQLPPNFVPNNRGPSRSPTGVMTPPQTPKAQQFPNADASGKKRKNKKQDKSKQERAKPKDVMTQILPAFSSVPIPVDIESPPMSSDELASGQITPPKLSSTPPSKAYAGPTFHSSPAPSALPKPKFFSKSVPATPAGNSLQTMMESDASDATAPASPDLDQEQSQSHLELLFRAARAENMGMKRQSSGSTTSSETSTDSSSVNFGYVGNIVLLVRSLGLTRSNQRGPRVPYS